MCSHHLVEPSPALRRLDGKRASREPGRPRPRTLLHAAAAIQELRRTQRLALRQVSVLDESAPIPSADQTIWEVFEGGAAEAHSVSRPFRWLPRVASTRCRRPVWCGSTTTNTRSAPAQSTPVDIHAYADRIVIRPGWTHGGRTPPLLRPGQTILALCAGSGLSGQSALRGESIQDWVLPAALGVQHKLASSTTTTADGSRNPRRGARDGLAAVQAGLRSGAAPKSLAGVVINILARQRDQEPLELIPTPASLRLLHAPTADCARYDQLGALDPWNEPESSTR